MPTISTPECGPVEHMGKIGTQQRDRGVPSVAKYIAQVNEAAKLSEDSNRFDYLSHGSRLRAEIGLGQVTLQNTQLKLAKGSYLNEETERKLHAILRGPIAVLVEVRCLSTFVTRRKELTTGQRLGY